MNWQAELRKAIMDSFSESDIKALCFDLGVDYDELPGDTKTEKVISLIDHFERIGEIPTLINYCSQNRPNIPWTEIEEAAKEEDAHTAPVPPRVDAQPAPAQRPALWIAAAAFIILALLLVIIAFVIVPNLNKSDEPEIAAQSTVLVTLLSENPQPTEAASAIHTAEPTDTAIPSTATPTVEPTETASLEPTAADDGACDLILGSNVMVEENARIWSKPDVDVGEMLVSLEAGQSVKLMQGPAWGKIRRDVDISGWWWEVNAEEGKKSGWLWEDRIQGCNDS